MLVPAIVHLPIFISTTLILRDACQRSLESLPHLPSIATSSYSSQALAQLHDFAASPFLWCDSLILPDPTLGLPLAVGLAALMNVEVGAKNRAAIARAARAGTIDRLEDEKQEQALPKVSRKEGALRQWELGQKRRYSVAADQRQSRTTVAKPPPVVVPEPEREEEPRTARLITNALRVSSVAFIFIALQAPAVGFRTSPSCYRQADSFDETGGLYLLVHVEYVHAYPKSIVRLGRPISRKRANRAEDSSTRQHTSLMYSPPHCAVEPSQ